MQTIQNQTRSITTEEPSVSRIDAPSTTPSDYSNTGNIHSQGFIL